MKFFGPNFVHTSLAQPVLSVWQRKILESLKLCLPFFQFYKPQMEVQIIDYKLNESKANQ